MYLVSLLKRWERRGRATSSTESWMKAQRLLFTLIKSQLLSRASSSASRYSKRHTSSLHWLFSSRPLLASQLSTATVRCHQTRPSTARDSCSCWAAQRRHAENTQGFILRPLYLQDYPIQFCICKSIARSYQVAPLFLYKRAQGQKVKKTKV